MQGAAGSIAGMTQGSPVQRLSGSLQSTGAAGADRHASARISRTRTLVFTDRVLARLRPADRRNFRPPLRPRWRTAPPGDVSSGRLARLPPDPRRDALLDADLDRLLGTVLLGRRRRLGI